MDRSSQTIFNRSEYVIGGSFIDGDEERLEGRAGHELNVFAEQFNGCLLAEGAALALKSYSCLGCRLCHKVLLSEAGGAGESIKPGVERSGTPGSNVNQFRARETGDSGIGGENHVKQVIDRHQTSN